MLGYLSSPFKWFFKLEAAGGLLLLISAIIALIISNSNYSEIYFNTLQEYIFIGFNNFGMKLSLLHWINDALMAIFFFFVTLEIKREFIQGELSSVKQALLPIIAAVGGMLVPALIYIFININNPETLNGWAIPSATVVSIARIRNTLLNVSSAKATNSGIRSVRSFLSSQLATAVCKVL